MRFVNCARNENEKNLVSFQHCGDIYYRTCKTIGSGSELLVWFDDLFYSKKPSTKQDDSAVSKSCSGGKMHLNWVILQLPELVFFCFFFHSSFLSYRGTPVHKHPVNKDSYGPTCEYETTYRTSPLYIYIYIYIYIYRYLAVPTPDPLRPTPHSPLPQLHISRAPICYNWFNASRVVVSLFSVLFNL